jgi:ABC-type multidrug transport system ATPase subunit
LTKPLLEVRNIRKTYGRKILAVDNLSFHVMEGEIYGLIGPNGAGKTTSLRQSRNEEKTLTGGGANDEAKARYS